jgi:L-fuconolactonase
MIDAHQHFIFPSRIHYSWLESENLKPLQRDFTPDDLRFELEKNKVRKTILVQTRHSLEETHEFLEIAADTDYVAGVVGWVDLTDPELETNLKTLLESKNGVWLKGIRHQIQEEPNPNWLLQPEVQRGLTVLESFNLVYDFVCSKREYTACLKTAAQHPKLQFVLDHAGKPDIKNNDFTTWQKSMLQFAALENVVVKISGLTTEAHWQTWTKTDLEPYINYLLEIFGSQGCMYGSDYPVCLLAGDYNNLLEMIQELEPVNQQNVLLHTASKIYKIS